MFNMFDMFRQAQGGAAFDNIARAYGMSPEQLRAMTAALTPAFAQGFQRQSLSDEGARRFSELFQTEAYARAFEAQAAALGPETRGAGEDALGALFGSKDVSRAVAAQAAAVSGVQAQIIRDVLPVLASILMGGFMKAMQGAGAPAAGFPGPFGEMFSGAKPSAASAPQNPFQGWMDAFGRVTPTQGATTTGNPLGDMMGEMMKGMFGGAAAETAPEPEPAAKPKAGKPKADNAPPSGSADDDSRASTSAAENPFDDLVATGRELSAQNAEAMSQIFDAFFGDKKKT